MQVIKSFDDVTKDGVTFKMNGLEIIIGLGYLSIPLFELLT